MTTLNKIDTVAVKMLFNRKIIRGVKFKKDGRISIFDVFGVWRDFSLSTSP